MKNEASVQRKVVDIKHALLKLREGKSKRGLTIPTFIRNEILELRATGWSVIELEQEFKIAASAIYRWIKNTDGTVSKNISGAVVVQNKELKIIKPKRLKIINDQPNNKPAEQNPQEIVVLEFPSGVKLYLPQSFLGLDFLKSINSL
jgi:hypothetical protein